MRTPLTGILGITDLLQETPLTAEQREYVAIVRSCAESLHDVLNATLEFASLSAGQARREDAPFGLRLCLDSLAQEHEAKARARGLAFRYELSGTVPEVVMGDEIRLRALLSQLLGNAVKFTPAGRIELRVRGQGGGTGPCWLDVEVHDSGIGIPADKLGRIFESFDQAGDNAVDSTVRQYAGLGLGLALARELTALLDGEITVESAVGEGSVFRVRLPIHPAHEQTALKVYAAAASAPMVAPGRPRVLLVEDNRVSQRIVSHMLERASFESAAVETGMDAVRAASGGQFDVVLMDLNLPGIDGIETAYRLRRLPGYAHTPVVALTANAGSEYRELCRQHGLQGFLPKPVQAEELVRTLEECLTAAA